MKLTPFQILVAIIMVITGSINTISIKFADMQESIGSDGIKKRFHHPFFQTCLMFFAEMFNFLPFLILFYSFKRRGDGYEDIHVLTKGSRTFNRFIMMIPALCDMIGTGIMFLGLNLTYASSFQMLRGSVIVFVAILSKLFLKRTMKWYEWIGIIVIIIGLSLVGLADYSHRSDVEDSRSAAKILTGDLLIITAEIFQAIQMVTQEKFICGKDIPALLGAGWEGTFGFIILGFVLIPFYYIRVDPPFSEKKGDRLEDVVDAFHQIANNSSILGVVIIFVISIAFYNFSGLSITKEFSATTRMVLDTIRTIIIWMVGLAFLGEIFHWLQLVGYIILLIGSGLYYQVDFGIRCKALVLVHSP